MYRYMVLMYRYNAQTRQKFEMSPFVSIQHVDVSIHKPLYRYQTPCIDTGPCQNQNLHSVKDCIDTHQHVSIQWFIVSIQLLIVSILWSLYRYRIHSIDTDKVFGPNVSIHYAMYRYMQVIFTIRAILTRPTLIRNTIFTHFFASWKIKTHI